MCTMQFCIFYGQKHILKWAPFEWMAKMLSGVKICRVKNGLRSWSLMKQNSSKLCKTFCSTSSSNESMQMIASTYFLFQWASERFVKNACNAMKTFDGKDLHNPPKRHNSPFKTTKRNLQKWEHAHIKQLIIILNAVSCSFITILIHTKKSAHLQDQRAWHWCESMEMERSQRNGTEYFTIQ